MSLTERPKQEISRCRDKQELMKSLLGLSLESPLCCPRAIPSSDALAFHIPAPADLTAAGTTNSTVRCHFILSGCVSSPGLDALPLLPTYFVPRRCLAYKPRFRQSKRASDAAARCRALSWPHVRLCSYSRSSRGLPGDVGAKIIVRRHSECR